MTRAGFSFFSCGCILCHSLFVLLFCFQNSHLPITHSEVCGFILHSEQDNVEENTL